MYIYLKSKRDKEFAYIVFNTLNLKIKNVVETSKL